MSLRPFRFSFSGVSHGISTRLGGVSPAPFDTLNLGLATADDECNVLTNRRLFLECLGVAPDQVVSGRLSHGRAISVFQRARREDFPLRRVPLRSGSGWPDTVFDSDAVISDVPGLHFMLTFADCVPLAFVDRQRGVVGAAHAGWRGTALGIGPAVVRAMADEFGSKPSDIQVGIGPSIGPCCYTVGQDVPEAFRAHGSQWVMNHTGGQPRLDLWETQKQQLVTAGVPEDSIESSRLCTSCLVNTFYSHRGERGMTGRFALCIGLQ